MSLVYAAVEGNCVWVVSDTAITHQGRALRERSDYLPKIEASNDKQALIGFAGNDADNAALVVRLLCAEAAGRSGLDKLIDRSAIYPNAEFAYAYIEDRAVQRSIHDAHSEDCTDAAEGDAMPSI